MDIARALRKPARRSSIARSGGSFFSAFRIWRSKLAVHPLHDHVNLAAVVVREDLHHAGMVESLADFLFALKAIEEHRIAFHFRVRDFDSDGAVRSAGRWREK